MENIQQHSEAWEVLKLPGEPRTVYHWACDKRETKHRTDVKIIEEDGRYKVLMAAKVAGGKMYRENWTLEMVNNFLSKLGFPSLPA